MKRRQFLQVAAAATAGFQIVPRRVLGGANQVAPSERIAMGFIGLGGQGTGHLLGGAWTYVPGGYVARDDVQVLAVCDVRKERRERRSNAATRSMPRSSARPATTASRPTTIFAKSSPGPTSTRC